MVAIHIGTKKIGLNAESVGPINVAGRGEVLRDSLQGNGEAQQHQKPGQQRKIPASSKSLRREEKNKKIGRELKHLDPRKEGSRAAVKEQLHKPDGNQRQQGSIERAPLNARLRISNRKSGPQNEERRGAPLQQRLGPYVDGAERNHGARKKNQQAHAQRLHCDARSAGAPDCTSEMPAIHTVPPS